MGPAAQLRRLGGAGGAPTLFGTDYVMALSNLIRLQIE